MNLKKDTTITLLHLSCAAVVVEKGGSDDYLQANAPLQHLDRRINT